MPANYNRTAHRMTGEQMMRQALEAAKKIENWRLEVDRKLTEQGFTWNAERGCWEHESGAQVWIG